MTLAPIARAGIHLGTAVTITVVTDTDAAASAIDRAFYWFREVEAACSRFDSESELMQLVRHVGTPVHASDLLFEAARFALAVAEETDGAFDPTIGKTMEARGFNRRYATGAVVDTPITPPADVSWRDVECDVETRTILLKRPLVLDLGAVAKGLAIDIAARELLPFRDFAIDAGGDLYLGGRNPDGDPWAIGIRHPRKDGQVIDVLRVSDAAVCTSGDYEKRAPHDADGHHILDPRTGASAGQVASATVVAPTAMLADAVATAAFVLGPVEGLELCESLGLEALVFDANLAKHETGGLPRE